MITILICFGTRPELIKVKSLIQNLPNDKINIKICFTGQHIDLVNLVELEQIANIDYSLSIKNINTNRLNNIFTNIFSHEYIFDGIDYILVQGDTSSACAIALSAFNHGKKIIHLEAGMRTFDPENPFPEEINRQIISRIATIHLCPTEINKINLQKENIINNVFVVGNTGLDNIDKTNCEYLNKVIITMHRRDNLSIISQWFNEFEKIASLYKDKEQHIEFLFISHPNPVVMSNINIFNKIKVINPLEHSELIEHIKRCKFVISDSGGLQEECSFLNKKIIVCRKSTERVESLNIHSFLCDEPDKLFSIVENVNLNYEINKICPYGDGASWMKIKNIFLTLEK